MSRAEWIIVALILGDLLVSLLRLVLWVVNQRADATYLTELRKLGATVLEATKTGPVIVHRASEPTEDGQLVDWIIGHDRDIVTIPQKSCPGGEA